MVLFLFPVSKIGKRVVLNLCLLVDRQASARELLSRCHYLQGDSAKDGLEFAGINRHSQGIKNTIVTSLP